jgi:sugar phosphate isomerase/epimerase
MCLSPITRRESLQISVGGLAALGAASRETTAAELKRAESNADARRFRYCLNTGTIQGQRLSLVQEIELVAKAGYDGIEPWIREIEQYQEQGGSLRELKTRLSDLGLLVEGAISFASWCVDDAAQRKQGLEDFRRAADLVRQIGGQRIAAPPAGASGADSPQLDLFAVAGRYAEILEIGRNIGVTPMVEIWGPSKNLSRLGEAILVAVESGQDDACVLPDIYHIYRGGSDFSGLKLLAGSAMHVFHVNDYPGNRPRTDLTDADRVHVGDGDAPVVEILRILVANDCRAALSLELFNRTYWQQDAETVAREGLEKIKTAVAAALG